MPFFRERTGTKGQASQKNTLATSPVSTVRDPEARRRHADTDRVLRVQKVNGIEENGKGRAIQARGFHLYLLRGVLTLLKQVLSKCQEIVFVRA